MLLGLFVFLNLLSFFKFFIYYSLWIFLFGLFYFFLWNNLFNGKLQTMVIRH